MKAASRSAAGRCRQQDIDPHVMESDDLWMCPECGHRFVTKNMWHSCSNFTLAHHFDRASASVRDTFDSFVDLIESYGPVEVIPQKTRIAVQAKVRFAGCVVRKKWLLANLWLTRRADHPKIVRVEKFGPHSYGHQFRFDAPSDLDEDFSSLVRESYSVGMREHLKR